MSTELAHLDCPDKPGNDGRSITRQLRNRQAQSIIEYVAVICVVVAVFIAMGAYYKRSLQARYRQAGDALGGGEQYTVK